MKAYEAIRFVLHAKCSALEHPAVSGNNGTTPVGLVEEMHLILLGNVTSEAYG